MSDAREMGYRTLEARHELAKRLFAMVQNRDEMSVWDVVDAVYELIETAPYTQRNGGRPPDDERERPI